MNKDIQDEKVREAIAVVQDLQNEYAETSKRFFAIHDSFQSEYFAERADALRVLIESVDSGWVEIKSEDDIPDMDAEQSFLFKNRKDFEDGNRYDVRAHIFAWTGKRGMAEMYSHRRKIVPPEAGK